MAIFATIHHEQYGDVGGVDVFIKGEQWTRFIDGVRMTYMASAGWKEVHPYENVNGQCLVLGDDLLLPGGKHGAEMVDCKAPKGYRFTLEEAVPLTKALWADISLKGLMNKQELEQLKALLNAHVAWFITVEKIRGQV